MAKYEQKGRRRVFGLQGISVRGVLPCERDSLLGVNSALPRFQITQTQRITKLLSALRLDFSFTLPLFLVLPHTSSACSRMGLSEEGTVQRSPSSLFVWSNSRSCRDRVPLTTLNRLFFGHKQVSDKLRYSESRVTPP